MSLLNGADLWANGWAFKGRMRGRKTYLIEGAIVNLREGVLAMDSVTKQPIQIRNDNGMEGIFVFGFDSTAPCPALFLFLSLFLLFVCLSAVNLPYRR